MFAFYGSIGIAVVANVFYHVAMKQTSERLDPLVSLLLTYLVAATTCLVAIPFFGRLSLRENIAYLGWPSVLLGISICFLELGFLLAYRAGWNLSTAALACNVAVGLLLIPLGLFYFKEHLNDCEWSRNSACDDGPVADWTARPSLRGPQHNAKQNLRRVLNGLGSQAVWPAVVWEVGWSA